MTLSLIVLGALLAFKHFLADGPGQTEWHVKNKGTFLHLGGISHSFNQALGTFFALLAWKFTMGESISFGLISGLVLFDFFTHYFIDLSKMKITKGKGYSAMGEDQSGKKCQMIYSNKFYNWLVADQSCHFYIYSIIIAVVAGSM